MITLETFKNSSLDRVLMHRLSKNPTPPPNIVFEIKKTSCFDRVVSLSSWLIHFCGAACLTVFKSLFSSPHSEIRGSHEGWQAVAESITTAQHNLYRSLKWFHHMKNGKYKSLELWNVKYLLHTYLLDRVLAERLFLFCIFRADFSKWAEMEQWWTM